MTLREMMRRIAGDDHRFVGVDGADAGQMAALLADEEVWYIVAATMKPDGSPHGIIRLVPQALPKCPKCRGDWNRPVPDETWALCGDPFHERIPT